MKIQASKLIPVLVSVVAIGVVCFVQCFPFLFPNASESKFDILQRLKWLSYDARVRVAAMPFILSNTPPPLATNLGAVFIDDIAIARMNDGSYGYRVVFPWPREIYGKIVRELAAQKATAVGFDILFAEELIAPAPDEEKNGVEDMTSDQFFAGQMRQASNVVLATEGEVLPPDLFLTNRVTLGGIYARPDYGVLRRVKPFTHVREWHPAVKALAKAIELDLTRPRFATNSIFFPFKKAKEEGEQEHEILLNPDGSLNLVELGEEAPPGPVPPFTLKRVWSMGIVLAAKALDLDLDNARIESDRVILSGKNGVKREVPVDREGYMYIDWNLSLDNIKSRTAPVHKDEIFKLLLQDVARRKGETEIENPYEGRVVVMGSVATGNNVADLGATPINDKTPLVTKHLNVANSIITNRFITPHSYWMELGLTIFFGIISANLAWRTRVLSGAFWLCFLAAVYVALGFILYIQQRYWLPLVIPVLGGMFLPHFSLITYRVIFEQKEQRRVKGVFKKIVAPEVVNELLSADTLALGGTRREITAYFADVRGFTDYTDSNQAAAEEYARKKNLTGKEATEYFDRQAAEVLANVNLYLGTISDRVKKHGGTLDKYMGDCVMAFWGAPIPNPHHALSCVRSAIDSQRAIYALNQERFAENERRKKENETRAAAGQDILAMLPLLSLGSGINTGVAMVGLMGSDAHIVNYTVFGREVNIASRLETVSQRGRIIISENTYVALKRDDPELAATCIPQQPVMVKGIRQAIKIYEVPWKPPAPPATGTSVASGGEAAPKPATTTSPPVAPKPQPAAPTGEAAPQPAVAPAATSSAKPAV